jgi:hypothetical protein
MFKARNAILVFCLLFALNCTNRNNQSGQDNLEVALDTFTASKELELKMDALKQLKDQIFGIRELIIR